MASQVRRCQAQARWENSRVRRDHARGQHGSRGFEEHLQPPLQNKDSRPTMFGPVPALGVLERDLMEWMRNYKTRASRCSQFASSTRPCASRKWPALPGTSRPRGAQGGRGHRCYGRARCRDGEAGVGGRAGDGFGTGNGQSVEPHHQRLEEDGPPPLLARGVEGLGRRGGRGKRRRPATPPCPSWHPPCGPSSP